jgi:hypothetical protein
LIRTSKFKFSFRGLLAPFKIECFVFLIDHPQCKCWVTKPPVGQTTWLPSVTTFRCSLIGKLLNIIFLVLLSKHEDRFLSRHLGYIGHFVWIVNVWTQGFCDPVLILRVVMSLDELFLLGLKWICFSKIVSQREKDLRLRGSIHKIVKNRNKTDCKALDKYTLYIEIYQS